MARLRDTDPAETREWLDSLDGVIEVEGQDRAAFLLDELLRRARRRGPPAHTRARGGAHAGGPAACPPRGLPGRARRRGTPVPYSATTPYLNTIPPEREARHPGDRAIEHRIRSYIRWNALAIILRANKESPELRGWQSGS